MQPTQQQWDAYNAMQTQHWAMYGRPAPVPPPMNADRKDNKAAIVLAMLFLPIPMLVGFFMLFT